MTSAARRLVAVASLLASACAAPCNARDPEPPLLRIDTADAAPIAARDIYVKGRLSLSPAGTIEPAASQDESPHEGVDRLPLQVKGRGNTTWDYPKKPLRIRLDEPADLLGMGADEDWVLLADFIDPSGLRNAIAFELGRRLGLPFTPHARHVNLVVNGTPAGLYLLTEQTEVDEHRVVTDRREGFLVEFDDYDGEQVFSTRILDLPLKIKYPDVADMAGAARDEAIARVTGAFAALEKMVTAPDGPGDYASLVDVDSLIDWFLVHEITHNYEPLHPKSCFFHRGDDGRITAGPLWDFDYAYDYEAAPTDVLGLRQALWFPHLFKDAAFREKLKARWTAIKACHVDTLPAYLDTLAAGIRGAVEQDQRLWPCDDDARCPADAATLRAWLSERIAALDAAIVAL